MNANLPTDLRDLLKMLDAVNADLARSMRSTLRRPPAPPGMRYLTAAEIRDREAEIAAAKAADADAELRLEVVEAMTATGIAPHVAANRTNTTAKLLAEGRAFGVI